MKGLWIIIALLPVIIVLSLVFGFELPLYAGIALVGVVLWQYSDDSMANMIGAQLSRIGAVLFVVAFLYYMFSGHFMLTQPFEFKFLRALIDVTIDFYFRVANYIGSVLLGKA